MLQLAIEHVKNLKAGRRGSTSNQDLMFTMDTEDNAQVKVESHSQLKSPEAEIDKRLSHNQVEQMRRKQAREHFSELRDLLPNASKHDKNTVLYYTIQYIRQMEGISEQALASMVSELSASDAENDADPADSKSALLAACSLAQLGNAPSLSGSPADVVSFASTLAWMPVSEQKQSRKRPSVDAGATIREESYLAIAKLACEEAPSLVDCAAGQQDRQENDTDEEAERKKSRTLSPKEEGPAAPTADAEKIADECKQAENRGAGDEGMDGLDALSLLSSCAVQSLLRTYSAQLQLSQPSTPQLTREQSWGENSIMSALPNMLLSGSSVPGSAGKASLVASAAATAARAGAKAS